jgi:hypothetical protein
VGTGEDAKAEDIGGEEVFGGRREDGWVFKQKEMGETRTNKGPIEIYKGAEGKGKKKSCAAIG